MKGPRLVSAGLPLMLGVLLVGGVAACSSKPAS